ncbi:MAG: toxin [Euryarchaeota archaeon]|nr:toxin [Euryarchaeota archaeon]
MRPIIDSWKPLQVLTQNNVLIVQKPELKKKLRLLLKRKCNLSVNIALTGTPGTGKTTLSGKLKYNIVSINDFYENISDGKDSEGNWLIDLEKLNDVIDTKNKLKNVYEGHVSHYLDNIDIVVVLRCNPNELKNRLNSRNYNDEKIKENLEAEALNIISDEAIEQYGEDNVFEIDTSTNEINNCAEMMVNIINGNIKSNKRIDYSETIMDWY